MQGLVQSFFHRLEPPLPKRLSEDALLFRLEIDCHGLNIPSVE